MDLPRSVFDFDCYDPHADLLELAIWAMVFWVEDHADFLAAPDSNVSIASSAADAAQPTAPDSNVSKDTNAADTAKSPAHASNVSNASNTTDAAKSPAHVGNVSTASSATDSAATISNERLRALAYYFSATDIFTRMRAEAERLTPASVGRLLSELGLPRDRTSRGRRFRLTLTALAKLLRSYIYVFDPAGAQRTYNRRFDF